MENKRYFILRFRCRDEAMLFRREDDFLTFLRIYEKRIRPLVETYAWSFTPEQAMFMAATRREDNRYIKKADELVKRYRRYHRKRNKGQSTLEKKVIHLPEPDKVTLRDTLVRLHCRPLLEDLGHDFAEYPWTSYLLLMGEKHPWLKTNEVMGWFGGKEEFRNLHHQLLINHVGKQESESENFVKFIH